jgi:hypothetical protein
MAVMQSTASPPTTPPATAPADVDDGDDDDGDDDGDDPKTPKVVESRTSSTVVVLGLLMTETNPGSRSLDQRRLFPRKNLLGVLTSSRRHQEKGCGIEGLVIEFAYRPRISRQCIAGVVQRFNATERFSC